jgi:hypothetical protein
MDKGRIMDNLYSDISEMKKDIKQLLVDVGILKYKASFFGMIGGALVVVATVLIKGILK